jgi:hypothetical protein
MSADRFLFDCIFDKKFEKTHSYLNKDYMYDEIHHILVEATNQMEQLKKAANYPLNILCEEDDFYLINVFVFYETTKIQKIIDYFNELTFAIHDNGVFDEKICICRRDCFCGRRDERFTASEVNIFEEIFRNFFFSDEIDLNKKIHLFQCYEKVNDPNYYLNRCFTQCKYHEDNCVVRELVMSDKK